MALTRGQAIFYHRDMWNWIADEIEKAKRVLDIIVLKNNYCVRHRIKVFNDCYLCEYVERNSFDCSYCPLDWGNNGKNQCCVTYNDEIGLYNEIIIAQTWEEQAEISRKIANLPERTDV